MNEWMGTLATYVTECPPERLATASTPGHTEGEKLFQCSGGESVTRIPGQEEKEAR